MKKIFLFFLFGALTLSSCGTYEISIYPKTTSISSDPTQSPRTVCNHATLVGDVTVPSGTIFTPGTAFTKTWRIKNTGTCTWTTSYKLVMLSENLVGGPGLVNLIGNVAPEETIDVSVNLIAPAVEGIYRGYWGLQNESGVLVDSDQLFIWIEIAGNTPTPIPALLKKYHNPAIGIAFDYPNNWYAQYPKPDKDDIILTSYDPGSPPTNPLEKKKNIALQINWIQTGENLDFWSGETISEASKAGLTVNPVEKLTLTNGLPAVRISMISGAGQSSDFILVIMNGYLMKIWCEGDFNMTKTILDTLHIIDG